MEDKLLESITYVLPALVTGGVAYYMMNAFVRQNNNEKIANTRMGNTRKNGSGFPMDSYPIFRKKVSVWDTEFT